MPSHRSGLIATSTLAGAAIGVADASDTLVGGFADGLGFADLAVVLLTSLFAVGAVGLVVGLLTIGALEFGSRVGLCWDEDGLRFRGRRRISCHVASGLVSATLVGGLAMLLALALWILRGTGAGRSTGLLIVGSSLVGIVVLGFLMSRSKCPRGVHIGAWVLALAGMYVLETRLLYMFSRTGKLALAHTALLPLFVMAAGAALWLVSERVRRALTTRHRGVAIGLLGFIFASATFLVVLECRGRHRVRTVLHDRSSLTFRVLELVPYCHRSRTAAIRESWRRGCPDPAVPRPPRRQPLVDNAPPLSGTVLILVDSLRSDRVLAERNGSPLMPNLKSLMATATTLLNSYTPAPGTTKAMTAVMASRFFDDIDPQKSTMLGTALRNSAVSSVIVSAHPNLAAPTATFDHYDDEASIANFPAYKNALTSEATVARTLKHLTELTEAKKRFVLVAHFFDPHAHYVENDDFDFGGSEADRYDAEVKFTDKWIGTLLAGIVKRPEIGVVLMSDHGDEFWEHRYKRHQLRLYDESTRVPTIIFDPRYPTKGIVAQDVSLLDIAPTVLAMMDVERPVSMIGQSLLPLVSGQGSIEPRPVFMHATDGRKWGVVWDRRKLILNTSTGIVELYDLRSDPAERRNLADGSDVSSPVLMAKDVNLACALEGWLAK